MSPDPKRRKRTTFKLHRTCSNKREQVSWGLTVPSWIVDEMGIAERTYYFSIDELGRLIFTPEVSQRPQTSPG